MPESSLAAKGARKADRSGGQDVVAPEETLGKDIVRGHGRVHAAVEPLRVYLDVLRLQSQTALVEEPTPLGVDEQTAALYDEARLHLDAFTDALRRAEAQRRGTA